MAQIIALTPDEIRTGMMFTDRYEQLKAAMEEAERYQSAYVDLLCRKYGVDGRWTVKSWLTGLELIGPEPPLDDVLEGVKVDG